MVVPFSALFIGTVQDMGSIILCRGSDFKMKLVKTKFLNLIVIMAFLFVLAACSSANLTQPPEVQITVNGVVIEYVTAKNVWNGAIFDRLPTLWIYANTFNIQDAPYFELGSIVQIEFLSDMPDSVKLYEYVIDYDGQSRYSVSVDAVSLQFTDNKTEFKLETNIMALLSSYSGDYEPGNIVRGFILLCRWGDNSAEYGFVIRSDAK